QLAGLYDQYQVHRPDWLQKWSNDPNHPEALPPEGQHWQTHLWQAVLAAAPESAKTSNRAFLHEPYLEALKANHSTLLSSGQIPSRLIVFGISSLPRQTLEAITALGTVSQVFFFVQNPCKHYWADLIEGRELLTHAAKRQARKPGTPEYMTGEDLHLHGNPLLAAWGKQGRDFVRLLEVWDDPEQYRDWFQKIDWYDDESSQANCLLHEVQNAILNLDPLPAAPEQRKPLKTGDDSIVFHIAHSPQREVEILHDQLLSLFDQPDTDRLEPRDVIVMVPDIDRYAPHIDAVFGQSAQDDARQIPYSLADQRERGHDPILMALEYLLNLPEARITASEVLNLLDLSTISRRFGLEAENIPLIRRWIREAGIRWGLDGAHRGRILGIQNPTLAHEQNTWQFGLHRLLLGYCMGDAQVYNDQIAP
ncbi:MAG: exodeoxyribonuclease V subunit gamma, partial [Methylococcaceae bacterium]